MSGFSRYPSGDPRKKKEQKSVVIVNQHLVNNKVDSVNGKTDAVRLVTSDIPEVVDHRYVTDAEQGVIQAISGTNTGDETTTSILTKIGDGSLISPTHLPSYVDDVLEFTTYAELPVTGETGKIYVILTGAEANKIYRWSGSVYVEILSGAGGATRGGITGTLSDQTDLQTALNGKLSSVVAGTNVTVDNTDPLNPVLSASGGTTTLNYLNAYKAPQLFNPTELQVTAGTADFTLSGASDVGIVTINGQTLDDSEYSLIGTTITVTPDNGFFDITDEVLVFQTVLAVSELPTGWASYVDTVHVDAGTAQTIPANTDTILDNNAGNIIDSQKPTHVTTFYDSTTKKITGRNGDNLDIMIYFKAVPSAVNQYLDIWLDIGGTVGELYRQTFNFPKGSGIERGILYALPSSYTLGTREANGAMVYIRSDAACDIYDINYNFDLSHKAR